MSQIDLLAGLSFSSDALEISADSLVIDITDDKIAQPVAEALASAWSDSLKTDGSPVKATVERRIRRAKHEGGGAGGELGYVTGRLAGSIRAVRDSRGWSVRPVGVEDSRLYALAQSNAGPTGDEPQVIAALNRAADGIVK